MLNRYQRRRLDQGDMDTMKAGGALSETTLGVRSLYFAAGILLLSGIIIVLAMPIRWPGALGQTFDHNLESGRDATGLFYTEVEDYWLLEHKLTSRTKP